ncbi:MAG: fibronectin type III domain-containing protein [Bacteroidetes bacterium]|nr:fibronectin type III domain-containing protein [Bacteroidota bacterium]
MKIQKFIKQNRIFRSIAYIMLVFYFSFSTLICLAQTGGAAINSTGVAADNSAMLDVSSDTTSSNTSQGLLIPRMGTSRRPDNPANGLIIYNTECNVFQYFDGTSWISLYSSNNYISNPENITGLTTFCPGQTGVTYSVSPITGVTSYNWTVPSGASITSGQNTNSITVDFGSTSGNICLTAINDCGKSSPTCMQVTNITIPDAAGTISGTSTVCQAQNNVSYSVPEIANATSYTWSLPYGATIISGSNTNSITLSFATDASSGDITVYGMNQTCTGAVSTAFPVTVNPSLATAGTITGQSTVCVGDYIVYTVDAIPNATAYVWTVPSNTSISGDPTSNSITVYFPYYYSSGNISVYATNSNCTGAASPAFQVIVDVKPPAAGVISGPTSVCTQNYATYTIDPILNATSYTWGLPSGAYIAGGGNTYITIYFPAGSQSGDITVFGKNSICDGTASSLAISVNELPAAAGTITGPASVCRGYYLVTYTIDEILNATSYTWTLPTNAVVSSYPTINSISVYFPYPSSPGDVITVCGTNAGCNGTVSTAFPVTAYELPAAAGTITGSPTICVGPAGAGNAYSVELIENATSYTWEGPGSVALYPDADPKSVWAHFAVSAESGNITVYGTNSGCSGTPSSIYVTVEGLSSATFSYLGMPYCSNATNPLPNLNDWSSIAGTFSSTEGLVFANPSTGEINLSASTPGYYNVTNTIASTAICPEVTATYYVTIISPSVPVEAAGSDAAETSFTANWAASTPNTATGYYLDVSTDNFASFLINSLDVGNVISYSVTGLNCGNTYYYRVRAYDASGCISVNSGTTTYATSSCFSATGGNVITSGGKTIHTFTTSGTFTVTGSGSIEVLVIGGGGGGGSNRGGGGGGGGYQYDAAFAVTTQDYTVTIGDGGVGSNGNNSVFSSIIAYGGGLGASPKNSGENGSSGGGASMSPTGGTGSQGYNGGAGLDQSYADDGSGGGGGGAGAAGGDGALTVGGNGGDGISNSISGSSETYAGGGGGSVGNVGTGGAGGAGGGGKAGNASESGTAGSANTGGGGGGGANNYAGAAGGSGIVIISYPTP